MWPEDQEAMSFHLADNAMGADQYLAPALFSRPDTQAFKLSNVVWCDFDEGIPDELGDFPKASLRVSSSDNDQKEHWYWRLAEPCRISGDLERYNKQLAY